MDDDIAFASYPEISDKLRRLYEQREKRASYLRNRNRKNGRPEDATRTGDTQHGGLTLRQALEKGSRPRPG